jgi:hypothetical protein
MEKMNKLGLCLVMFCFLLHFQKNCQQLGPKSYSASIMQTELNHLHHHRTARDVSFSYLSQHPRTVGGTRDAGRGDGKTGDAASSFCIFVHWLGTTLLSHLPLSFPFLSLPFSCAGGIKNMGAGDRGTVPPVYDVFLSNSSSLFFFQVFRFSHSTRTSSSSTQILYHCKRIVGYVR